jgi:hypothetical protein
MFKLFSWLGFGNEGWNGTREGVRDMKATITETNGKFKLVEKNTGRPIGTYSRARDAKRGATRRGYAIV